MNKNTVRKIALISVISGTLLLGGMWALTNKSNNKQKQPVKSEQNDVKTTKTNQISQEQHRFYQKEYEQAFDSLLITKGFYNDKYDEINTLTKNYKMLDSLENELCKQPQLEKMKKQVKDAADNIIDTYAKQMVALVKPVNDTISHKYIADKYKNSAYYENMYMFVCPEKPILAGEPFTFRDHFLYNLFNVGFDWKNTNKETQNTIKGKVYELCKKMEIDLYDSRKKIEKKFSQYYSELNPNNVPDKYKHLVKDPAVNETDYGTTVDYSCVGDIVIARTANLYIDVADTDFLDDKNTTFTKDKDDSLRINNDSLTIHTTFDISDLWDTIVYKYRPQEEKLESCYFFDDEQVCIETTEILFHKKSPKTDTITGYNKTKQKCDSLNKEIERKHQINAHREDSIVKPARIKAKQIADKRFLNKYRQKYR